MNQVQPHLLQAELEKQRRQVDVDNYDLTLGEIVRMAEANELIRAPEYQRKFRWSHEDESYLIESLLLGLPVPSVYVASNPDGTWEVVDGLQRLSTLIHFMSNNQAALKQLEVEEPLRLTELKKLPSFNNYRFLDLPTPIRLQFGKRSLRVTALTDKSDPEIRFEVFERLNKGGVSLSPSRERGQARINSDNIAKCPAARASISTLFPCTSSSAGITANPASLPKRTITATGTGWAQR